MPPAWTDVWYCVDPQGHIQATGRDEKGRKQYVYHADWRERRERSKYAHDRRRCVCGGSGKPGRPVDITVSDKKLAKILLRCEELPGQQLFRYRNGDGVKEVDSARFNEYLREASGADITAKDFRTWIGTVTVVEAWLANGGRPLKIKEATAVAAKRLANTSAVTRRSYIHPRILEIVTQRSPRDAEARAARRHGARLSGPERLCARLLEEQTAARARPH